MKFEKLETWMAENKKSRVEYLDKLKEVLNAWSAAYCEAYNHHDIRKEIEVDTWSPAKGRFKQMTKAVPVLINGKEYLDYGYEHTGKQQYLSDCGYCTVSKQDVQLVTYYTKAERLVRIERDCKMELKNIIARVTKICTPEISEVADLIELDGLYIKGQNGKVAHMWAILAGGYNIQRLHIRVLVKAIV